MLTASTERGARARGGTEVQTGRVDRVVGDQVVDDSGKPLV